MFDIEGSDQLSYFDISDILNILSEIGTNFRGHTADHILESLFQYQLPEIVIIFIVVVVTGLDSQLVTIIFLMNSESLSLHPTFEVIQRVYKCKAVQSIKRIQSHYQHCLHYNPNDAKPHQFC